MNSFRNVGRHAIAILGLVAVLVGAFEHESLLFQPRSDASKGEVAAHLRPGEETAGDIERFEAYPHASGTQGTFRSESRALALVPRMWTALALSRSAKAVHVYGREATPPYRGLTRSQVVGTLALRL